jgi:hypothetical protein
MDKGKKTERSITVGERTYRLKDRITLADYRAWAECNPLSVDGGVAGLNAVLAIPLGEPEQAEMEVEDYLSLHQAVFGFFVALRWGQSAPSAS